MRILLSLIFITLLSFQSFSNDLLNSAIEQSIEETDISIQLSKKIIERIENEDPEKGIEKKVLKKDIKTWLKELDNSMKIVLKNSTFIYNEFQKDEAFFEENGNIIESENNVIGRIFDYNLETRVYWKEFFKSKSDEGDFYNAQTAITRLAAQLPIYMKYLDSLNDLVRS